MRFPLHNGQMAFKREATKREASLVSAFYKGPNHRDLDSARGLVRRVLGTVMIKAKEKSTDD